MDSNDENVLHPNSDAKTPCAAAPYGVDDGASAGGTLGGKSTMAP